MDGILDAYTNIIAKMIDFANEYRNARGTSLSVPLNECCYEVISTTAKLGVCRYPWCLTRIVLAAKWEEIFIKAVSEYNGWDEDITGNSFESAKQTIADYFLQLRGPPVTLQRICELLKSHPYSSAQKLFNAFRRMTAVRGLLSNPVSIPAYADLSLFPILNSFEKWLGQSNNFFSSSVSASSSPSNASSVLADLLYSDIYNNSYDWLDDTDSDSNMLRSRSVSCSFYEGEKDEPTRIQRKRKAAGELLLLYCESNSSGNNILCTMDSSVCSSPSSQPAEHSSSYSNKNENVENSHYSAVNLSSNEKISTFESVSKDTLALNNIDYEVENASSDFPCIKKATELDKVTAPHLYSFPQLAPSLRSETNACKFEEKNSFNAFYNEAGAKIKETASDRVSEGGIEFTGPLHSHIYNNHYCHNTMIAKNEDARNLIKDAVNAQKNENVCNDKNSVVLRSIFNDYGDDEEENKEGDSNFVTTCNSEVEKEI